MPCLPCVVHNATSRYESEMVLYNSATDMRSPELTKAPSCVQVAKGVIDIQISSKVPFKVLIYTKIPFKETTGARMLVDKFDGELRRATEAIRALKEETIAKQNETKSAQSDIAVFTASQEERNKTLECVFRLRF